MSVLKEKRTVSKAEYVNTANQIYVETVGFLTRLSARYSRLIAEGAAQLAGEVMDHTEKANKIYPSDEQRKAQRKVFQVLRRGHHHRERDAVVMHRDRNFLGQQVLGKLHRLIAHPGHGPAQVAGAFRGRISRHDFRFRWKR